MRKSGENKLVSVVAVFIALLALLVSLYEGYEIRKHNRLSLKPYLDLQIHFENNEALEISIENAGLGPAIIQNFEIHADGQKARNWNHAMEIIDVSRFSYLNNLQAGEIIPPGESITLIKVDTLLKNYGITFVLNYTSMYEENYAMEYRF